MNEKLSELLDNATNCLKQVYKDMTLKSEENRKLAEVRLQKEQEIALVQAYKAPYDLSLDSMQIDQLNVNASTYGNPVVTLTESQSYDITSHYIKQAKLNNDKELLQQVRIEASTDLNSNFDAVRILHKDLYINFIYAYYPYLTYANVTPTNTLCIVEGLHLGLVYSFALDRQVKLDDIKSNFNRFKNTYYCQKLFREFNITSANISYDSNNYNLMIFLK